MKVKEGKALQVVSASSDVFSVYQGAPLYNLVGVALWLLGEKEKAYRFFYTALTMNPLNGDYLFNLREASRELKREEDLENLLTLLLSGEANE